MIVYKNITESRESETMMSRTGENTLCNLVCDAFKELGEADITILNAGAVRMDIDAGNITYQEIVDVMPFSNDIVVKRINGQSILDMLEFGIKDLPNPSSRYPQVSEGVTYKIDESINSSVVVDKNGDFIRVDGKRKVYDVKINGDDLDLNKNYTISTSYYILKGGDGFSMLTPHEVTKTAFGADNEILLKYINETLKGVIPSKYKEVQNRIEKTDGKIYNNFTKYYNEKSSSGLSGGMIAIIVIVPIFVLAITIGTIYLLKRKGKNINEMRKIPNISNSV